MKSSQSRWRRRLRERATQRASQLDALLTSDERGLRVEDRSIGDGPVDAERLAARALAQAATSVAPPASSQTLAVIRASLAAQRSTRRDAVQRRVRFSLQMASAAAMVAVVTMAVAVSDPTERSGQGRVAAFEDRATVVLAALDKDMEMVRDSVAEGDRDKAQSAVFEASDTLDEARQTAVQLPRGNSVRDQVLTEALNKISELQSLATTLQLEVPPLASPTPAPSSAAVSTTTSPPSSIVVPASVSTTTTNAASPTSSVAPTTTVAPAPSTTTTSTPAGPPATTDPTTTTQPPAPTTTTTTVPSSSTTTAPSAPTTTTAPPPTTTTTMAPSPPPATTTTAAPSRRTAGGWPFVGPGKLLRGM